MKKFSVLTVFPIPSLAYTKFDDPDPNFPGYIWKLALDYSGVSQVTSDAAWSDFTPTFNNAYSKIVYHREPADGSGTFNIAVVNADGSNIIQLTSVTGSDTCTNGDWDPTADQIVFAQKTVGIRRINADGTGLTTLVALAGSDRLYRPQYNSNGTKIIYMRRIGPTQTTHELRCCDADGSNDIQVDATAYASLVGSFFSWFHGSNKIVYGNSTAGTGARFFTVNADGTGKTTIYTGVSGDSNALITRRSVSADDDIVVVSITASGVGSTISNLKLDGTGMTALSPTIYRNTGSGPIIVGGRTYARKYVQAGSPVYSFVSVAQDGSDSRIEDTPGIDISIDDMEQ